MSDATNFDQTDFIETAVLRDEHTAVVHPPAVPSTAPASVKSIKKPPLLLFFVLAVAIPLGVLALVVGARMTTRGPQNQEALVSPTPAAVVRLPDALQKMINDLSTQIRNADPTTNDLPFPPVNFALHLKPPTVAGN